MTRFYDLTGDDEHSSERIARAFSDDTITPKEWAAAYDDLTRAYLRLAEENEHLRMQLLLSADPRKPQ